MTECERIINDGILKMEFFEEEDRCGFHIDRNRKKIWAVELDLLLQLEKICSQHNIKFFLDGGSVLGAVRHKGFIPWDDDIDIGMPRNDYEKFLEIGQRELKAPYFLQTPYSDSGYYFSFAKLRNSNTSFISKPFIYEKFNQGICIDIFPLDIFPTEGAEDRYNRIKMLNIDNSTYMRRSNPNPSYAEKQRLLTHSGRAPLDVCNEIQMIATQFRNQNVEYMGDIVCTIYDWKKSLHKKEVFNGYKEIDFECFRFPVPVQYESYLSTLYGNWKEFPPLEKRGVWHDNVIIDPDVPYKKKIEEIISYL